MGVIEILSSRREYTKAGPFVVLLAKGNHEVTSSWTHPYGHVCQTTLGITRSNITFIGQGIGETTILGGFGIHNKQNITLKQMTVTNTNTNSHGIQMHGAEVELGDVRIVHCGDNGLRVQTTASNPSQLVATRCEISNNSGTGLYIYNSYNNTSQNVCLKNCISHHNNDCGIFVLGKGVVNIHGDASAIHSNGSRGIFAAILSKVIFHLPSHHNTVYNNKNVDFFFVLVEKYVYVLMVLLFWRLVKSLTISMMRLMMMLMKNQ